jgi:hypothetical protein
VAEQIDLLEPEMLLKVAKIGDVVFERISGS